MHLILYIYILYLFVPPWQVSHTNINLAGQLEDYQAQTKVLIKELDDKNEEIARLKAAQRNSNEDVTCWVWHGGRGSGGGNT